ncbi:MAG: DUF5819 family protein [Flavobacteriales bacterium]|nr:DUF5819 family protein [Flavobacteriales bacterium]
MEKKRLSPWLVFSALAGTAFALFHFVNTLVYSIPELKVPGTAKEVSNQYMTPFFHQGWKLFAPDVPAVQYSLEYRFPEEGKWNGWTNAEDLPGISSHPRVEYIIQKMELYLANDMRSNLTYNPDSTVNFDLIVDDAPYQRVLYYAVRRHESIYLSRPDSVQLRLNLHRTPPFDGSEKKEDISFQFPVYRFKQ